VLLRDRPSRSVSGKPVKIRNLQIINNLLNSSLRGSSTPHLRNGNHSPRSAIDFRILNPRIQHMILQHSNAYTAHCWKLKGLAWKQSPPSCGCKICNRVLPQKNIQACVVIVEIHLLVLGFLGILTGPPPVTQGSICFYTSTFVPVQNKCTSDF
jgi:hypothetical protein